MEPSIVFIVMWYSSKADPRVIDFNNGNKTEIFSRLVGKDNYSWSMIDMGIEDHTNGDHHDTDYTVLYQIINGKKWSEDQEYVQKQGPIINVIRKTKGVKITGKGIPEETNDQVEAFMK